MWTYTTRVYVCITHSSNKVLKKYVVRIVPLWVDMTTEVASKSKDPNLAQSNTLEMNMPHINSRVFNVDAIEVQSYATTPSRQHPMD